jgi:hypothetical protein
VKKGIVIQTGRFPFPLLSVEVTSAMEGPPSPPCRHNTVAEIVRQREG